LGLPLHGTAAFHFCEPGLARRIVAEHIERVFAKMESLLADFDLSVVLILATELELKTAASQVFVESLVAYHSN
jgi:hypothetical protein